PLIRPAARNSRSRRAGEFLPKKITWNSSLPDLNPAWLRTTNTSSMCREKESEDHNPEHVFDPERLGASLLVRNWRPGDRFWPAHTKEPKKIKDLLQARHLPALERKCWPVIVSGNEIVWVRGFPGRAHFRPAYGQANAGILIREVGQNPRGEAR